MRHIDDGRPEDTASSRKHLLPQLKNMTLICTEVKDKNITVFKIKNKRLLKCKSC
jgi:hypothetical protein